MSATYYVLPDEPPPPFVYTRRQIADGIGVLVAAVVGFGAVFTLMLGAWGW
jgi:hypothetical protein